MLNKNKIIIGSSWMLLFVYQAITSYHEMFGKAIWVEIVSIYVFILITYYTIVAYLKPRFYNTGQKKKFILYSILAYSFFSLLRAGVQYWILLHLYHLKPERLFIPSLLAESFSYNLLCASAMAGLTIILKRILLDQRIESLQQENIQKDLNLLKHQISPHTVFNAINSIYALIERHNTTAREALHRFSSVLRYQLYESASAKVQLRSEVEFISNMVAIYKLRSEDVSVALALPEVTADIQIAPFLFIPFIENAFKFISKPGKANGLISISLHLTGNQIVFESVNSYSDRRLPGNDSGIGIANAQKRLDLLYPGTHTLDLHQGADLYSVTLKIDL